MTPYNSFFLISDNNFTTKMDLHDIILSQD